jgi:hypothetical protein
MATAISMLLFALVSVLPQISDAGIIRRGGAGSATGPVSNNIAFFLLPTATFSAGPTSETVQSLAGVQSNGDRYAYYGVNSESASGWAIQTNNQWDADCERGYIISPTSLVDCFFQLEPDEAFTWGGQVVGLPENQGIGTPATMYAGAPQLDYRWLLTDATGTELSLNSVFGAGLVNSPRGAALTTSDAIAAGCFSIFQETYNRGECQLFDLTTTFTGRDFIDQFGSSADLFLQLEVTISPTEPGFEFFAVVGGSGGLELTRGGNFFVEPTQIRELSAPLRITAVPAPATLALFAGGLLLLLRDRRRYSGHRSRLACR